MEGPSTMKKGNSKPPWALHIHPLLGNAFRIYNLDIEEKQRNGRAVGDFKFV